MSAQPPIPCAWIEGVFRPLASFLKIARDAYGEGEVVTLAPVEERSEVSHRHEFAWLKEAWQTLPEPLAAEYPSVEHLRKRALIATGFCTTTDYVCSSRAEAARWADNLRRELDRYTLIIVSEGVVRVFRAKSQSRRAMSASEFQDSKTAILQWVSDQMGVTPQELQAARAA